jgi:hypothetical protein
MASGCRPTGGVSGHFMVKAQVSRGQVLIDPFTGQSLSREDLVERLAPFSTVCPSLYRPTTCRWGCSFSPQHRATSLRACCAT